MQPALNHGPDLPGDALQLALDAAVDGVLIEVRDKVIYANSRYAVMLGYHDRSELIGTNVRNITDPEDCERLLWFARCREHGDPAPGRYTFRIRRRDGGSSVVDASVSAATRGDDTLIMTIIREKPHAEGDDFAIPGWELLASRELEIVKHLIAGRRPKEIAFLLKISDKTVATHRTRALVKLKLKDDFELFRFAARYHIIDV